MSALVVAEKLSTNYDELIKQFSVSFKKIGLDIAFKKAKAVFIKPNLTYPYYKKGVTTRIEFIKALITALKQLSNNPVIYVGEGEGGYNSFSMSEGFAQMEFNKLEDDFEKVKVINLSHMTVRDIVIDTLKGPYKLGLPEIFFDEIDFSISCPVPKVHGMTGISLSYKNQWGCIPDIMRLKNHYMFNYIISKIGDILKFKYAFLDGRYGLNNNGPMVGDSIELNWFAASNSLGAFDVIVSKMMEINWKDIKHLRVARKYGFIPDINEIKIDGNIEDLKRKLVLKRTFWHYPALMAFNSKKLTQFFYFSKWAKLLHDIMYTFRKRPID